MRWNSGLDNARRSRLPIRLLGMLTMLCVVCFSQPEQKQFTVYTPQTSYSLPVLDRNGGEYVGLAELLEPMGSVTAKLEGKKWKLRFNDREAQFQVGKTKAKVYKRDEELGAAFFAENGRGFVPLRTLVPVLTELLAGHSLNLHEQSRRLFVDKTELHYAAEVRKTTSSQLVITFSAPVNPFIATEPGKLRMVFRREPVLPNAGGATISFDDKMIPSLAYSEANGVAELTVNGNAPLIASFSNDRRTITITNPVQPQVAQAPPPPMAPPVIPEAAKPAVTAPQPKFLVMIDPAHGGDDRGGAITDALAEKDVTLAFARRLHKELEARGIAAQLLRDGDATITADQRAVTANAAMPSLFITIHAAGSGAGVRVFTAKLKAAPRTSVFLPWDTAQAAYVGASQQVASGISTELLKHDISSLVLPASVRPLNNIAVPALAIELAAPSGGKVETVNEGPYQQLVSNVIAAAVANARGGLPHAGAGR